MPMGRPQPKPVTPDDASALEKDRTLSEEEKVRGWRFEELLGAGYSLDGAQRVALGSYDLHQACEAVSMHGCDPELAVQVFS